MKYKVPEVARYRILRVLQVSTQKRDKLPNCENHRVTENTEVQNLHGYGNHSRVPEKQKIDHYWSYRGVAKISAVKKDRKKQETENRVTKLQDYEYERFQKNRSHGVTKINPRVTEQQEKPSLESYMFYLFVLFCFFAFFFQLSFSKEKQNKTSPEPLLLESRHCHILVQLSSLLFPGLWHIVLPQLGASVVEISWEIECMLVHRQIHTMKERQSHLRKRIWHLFSSFYWKWQWILYAS